MKINIAIESTDEHLLRILKSGNKEIAGVLYERYKRVLWAYFYNNSQDEFFSEEMVQVTFEKVLKYHKSYKFQGSVRSWIFTIARNALFEQWKKKKHLSSLESIQETATDKNLLSDLQLIRNERKTLLSQAINQLDPKKRELVSMIKLQELSYNEAAKIYGVSAATLKVRVFRIVTELKEYMKKINAKEHY